MPEDSAPALRVYPSLWQRSLEQHPTSWKDQFRRLCQLARAFRRSDRAAYVRLPEGEKLFLQALSECDVEDLVATIATDWGRGKANPLSPFDPTDPGVPRLSPVTMNGHKVFDA
jgi:hypothetical protein